MHPQAALIHRFYTAFARGDIDGMALCYHPEVIFRDPVFGDLHGADVMKMWRMLIFRSKGELKISHHDIHADNKGGSVEWRADYAFSTTGRNVTNKIFARFEFRDGKIIRHEDRFDLWRWARQALGWQGLLLGWSPWFRQRLRSNVRNQLNRYA